jgi:putative hydrolase of the HAD superfamily
MTDFDAVLLDLDGTLCEYVRTKTDLLAAAFGALDVEPPFSASDYVERVDLYADRADSMAERRRLCFAELAEENGFDPEIGRKAADVYADERDHSNVRFLDGAETALDSLADRYPLALVTNGGPDMQDQKIAGLGIRDYFETVVYAGHDVPAKPDPAPFEQALAALETPPERAVYVGNNYESDVVGAANAGLQSVLIGEPPRDRPVEPLAVTATPAKVPDLV